VANVSDTFKINFLGSVSNCRTEAEVSLRHAPSNTDPLCAVVYESELGPAVEWFGSAVESKSPALTAAVEDAKLALLNYVNRRGLNPPEGLTRAGLSMWLLEKRDGTAIGAPLRSAT
jgi:hypothetical protein